MMILRRAFAAMLVLLLLSGQALAEFQAVVKSSSMKVYSTNRAQGKYLLGALSKGIEVTVVATSGSWSRITYNGRVGYAQNKDMSKVTSSGSSSESSKTLAYTNRMVKVYSRATASSGVIDTLTCDYPVHIIGSSGSYYKVTNIDGRGTGYIYKGYLSETKKNQFALASRYKKSYSSSNSSTTMPSKLKSTQYAVGASMEIEKRIEYIIYAAQSRLGCAYKNSGANNNTTFKNAGFVRACFSQLKYSLPSGAGSIGHNGSYDFISRKDLKRGDIVCFDCDSNDSTLVDHVGIYLGSGYFIHASSAAGCVVVSKMSSGYYYDAFCWGRRVIK